jgi:molybdate transport system ATP-binding protein
MIKLDIKKVLFGAKGEMLLDVSLDIKRGEFLVLRGESGSGKTTLLRVLAGLESAKGRVEVDGEVWLDGDKNIFLAPQKREIGFIFQDYALFPNMSVEENLLFVNRDLELAKHLLDITNLFYLKNRYPNSLSGGQKQRVALARALMRRPKLLLMDEPLSALDPKMRLRLQEQILELHKEFKTTTIMVSHDLAEIYTLADRVVLMEFGKVIEIANTRDLLLENSNHLELIGKVLSLDTDSIIVLIGKDIVRVPSKSLEFEVGESIRVLVDGLYLKLSKLES